MLLFGVDEDAFDPSQEEIQEEISRVNEFTQDCIDSVFKLPKTITLKITFCNTAPALRE